MRKLFLLLYLLTILNISYGQVSRIPIDISEDTLELAIKEIRIIKELLGSKKTEVALDTELLSRSHKGMFFASKLPWDAYVLETAIFKGKKKVSYDSDTCEVISRFKVVDFKLSMLTADHDISELTLNGKLSLFTHDSTIIDFETPRHLTIDTLTVRDGVKIEVITYRNNLMDDEVNRLNIHLLDIFIDRLQRRYEQKTGKKVTFDQRDKTTDLFFASLLSEINSPISEEIENVGKTVRLRVLDPIGKFYIELRGSKSNQIYTYKSHSGPNWQFNIKDEENDMKLQIFEMTDKPIHTFSFDSLQIQGL